MNLDVPDEYDEWPHDARRFVLAEANSALDLRHEIDGIVGIDSEYEKARDAHTLNKEELAAVVIALGGPQRAET